MNCFKIFKGRRGKSSPELRNQENNKSDDLASSSSSSSRKIKSTGSLASQRSVPEMYKEKEHNLRVFSFSELKDATNNFSRLLKIGEGGFGSVYKGTVRAQDAHGDLFMVAIKKLNRQGLQGHKQWLAEVQFLGIVEHPNLVKLVGYCSVDGERGIQRLLVYEYMPNKSLEDHLFHRAAEVLPWETRLEIILGAAQGLAYLHSGMEVQVIYRDFKPSNVLLDMDFKAKLSDFGLAREGPMGNHTHVSTMPVGTYGYAAPEYVETGHLTTRCDLWSFGVVLYEIITGRRALERSRPTTEQKLLNWVKRFPVDSKKFSTIIDPRIRNQYSLSAARKIAKLAENCLNKNPKERPTMDEVVEILKQTIQESEEMRLSEKDSKSSSSNLNTRFTNSAKKAIHLVKVKKP